MDCYQEIIDTKIGKEAFITLKDHVRNLSLLLDSSDINCRKRVLVLLSILCKDEKGWEFVDDSMSHYKHVKVEKTRFEHLIRSIQNFTDEDYIVKVFYLLNSLLTGSSTSLQIHRYKKEFEILNIVNIINDIKKTMKKGSVLENQITVFEEECREDEDLTQVLKEPQAIINAMYINTNGSEVYENLLNILINLYQYSKKALESSFSEKQVKGWKLLEKIIETATLNSSKTGDIQTINIEIEKLKQEVEILQKDVLNLEEKNSKSKEELENEKIKRSELENEKKKLIEERDLLVIQERELNNLIETYRKSYENEKTKVNLLKDEVIKLEKLNSLLQEKKDDNYKEKYLSLHKSFEELKLSHEQYKQNSQMEIKKLLEKTKEIEDLDESDPNLTSEEKSDFSLQKTPIKSEIKNYEKPKTPRTPKIKPPPIAPPPPGTKNNDNCNQKLI